MAPIDEALDFLKSSESVNYADTARKFNCKQRSRRDADSLYKSRLSKQQERDLIAYIHKLSARGIPPTLSMIKNFAQDIAKVEVGKHLMRFCVSLRTLGHTGCRTHSHVNRQPRVNRHRYVAAW
ncbi:Tc5 transposase DNA-binding domain-containing protein [Hirsutella rhossiliensis]